MKAVPDGKLPSTKGLSGSLPVGGVYGVGAAHSQTKTENDDGTQTKSTSNGGGIGVGIFNMNFTAEKTVDEKAQTTTNSFTNSVGTSGAVGAGAVGEYNVEAGVKISITKDDE